MIAHCYFRFSHTDQAKGSSIDRQRADTAAHVGKKGWQIGDEYIDEAKSATKARHRAEGGELYRFEAEARDGMHDGAVLVVEKLDRLSRRGHDDTYALIKQLGSYGVHIATVDGDQFFEAGKELPLIDVLTILIKAEAARDEVQKKGERVKDAHARRRAKAEETGCALGKLAPHWLKVDPANNKYVVIPERAAVVQRIFDMADAGDGAGAIARKLNGEKVEPWQRWSSRVVRAWDRTRIRKILGDEAVLGWRNSSVADPIKIYPPIIAADLFERVRRLAPIKGATRGGARSPECANLVTGIAKCAVCGSSMMYDRKHAWKRKYLTKAGNEARLKHHAAQLICRAAHNGGCENRKGIAYHGFEQALLNASLHVALDDRAFVQTEELSRASQQLAEAVQGYRRLSDKAKKLWEAWADDVESDMRRTLAEKAEREAREIQEEVNRLTAIRDKAAGKASQAEHFGRIAEIRKKLDDPDTEVRRLHRKKVQLGLRSVITHIFCDEQGVATVAFAGGLAAVQIERGKVIAQASAVRMFGDGDFSALKVPNHMARDVFNRITKTLIDNGSMKAPVSVEA